MIHPVLVILTSRDWSSIEYLAKILDLDKPEIKHQIAYLKSIGIKLIYHKEKGYKLEKNISFLNYQQIIKNIPTELHGTIDLHIADIITSTNDIIKDIPKLDNKFTVLCAEYQTKARGRRQKKWINKFGSSVCMSLRMELKQSLNTIYALSLVIAIAIVTALKSIKPININIKWPNDIIVLTKDGYHKLAGILIESYNNENGLLEVIIGIGININLLQNNITKVGDNKIVDLVYLYGDDIDRNLIVARVISYILPYANKFLTAGLSSFIPRWCELDALYSRDILIKHNSKTIKAKHLGINNNGGLVAKVNNETQTFYSGDISLRLS